MRLTEGPDLNDELNAGSSAPGWRELYFAAVLETDRAASCARIDLAETRIKLELATIRSTERTAREPLLNALFALEGLRDGRSTATSG